MKTEILLVIEGVKNGKEFREHAYELNGMTYAQKRKADLLAQTGLPDWQPNITNVTIKTREVSDWTEYPE